INLTTLLNQPTWSTGDAQGLTNAIDDISGWLNEDASALVAKILGDIKKYQHGTKGWDVIFPFNGLVNGNWYMILPADDSVFSNLTEKNVTWQQVK
ncbi:MAG: hypothetical protein M3Q97_08995, partial [Bacteroidota bacterium]|nr:hypothetical protein [Bacteroidota bacterium]